MHHRNLWLLGLKPISDYECSRFEALDNGAWEDGTKISSQDYLLAEMVITREKKILRKARMVWKLSQNTRPPVPEYMPRSVSSREITEAAAGLDLDDNFGIDFDAGPTS